MSDVIDFVAWHTVYAMHCHFLIKLQAELFSIETSDFLKQINFLKSFNSAFDGVSVFIYFRLFFFPIFYYTFLVQGNIDTYFI